MNIDEDSRVVRRCASYAAMPAKENGISSLKHFIVSSRLLLILVFCVPVTIQVAYGQGSQASHVKSAGLLTIAGEVFQTSGQPASGARVTLRSAVGSHLQTTTDSAGAFTFSDIDSKRYTVLAETQTLRSAPMTIIPHNGARQFMRIVLSFPQSTTAPASSQGMAFTDEPDFVVSGVTDWTAVGGHGSDAALRTSEDLARATSALNTRNTSPSSIVDTEEIRLRAALAAKPNGFETNFELGEFYLRRKDYRQALTLLRTASAISEQRPEPKYDLALVCRELNDIPQAKLYVEHALTLKESADYHRLAGELNEQQGDPYAAVQHMERATRLIGSEENYFAWGSELLLHRAVLQAAEIFQRGATMYSSSVRMQIGLGSALFAEAHYGEASRRLCAASDMQPNDPAPYLLLGSIDEAAPTPLPCVKERLARFLKLSPRNSEASYLYGMSLIRRTGNQNYEESEALLKEAVKLNPAHAAALLQLGIFAAAQQHYPEAIVFYQRATAADPTQAETHYRLSVAYDRTGQSEQAASERDLHNSIKLRNAEAVELQRRTVKQFLIVLKKSSASASSD